MSEEEKNETQKAKEALKQEFETEYKKRIKRERTVWILAFVAFDFALICIWLFTSRQEELFVEHFSFAATVTSIILSVIAIFMSISGEVKTQTIRDKIEQEANQISGVSEKLLLNLHDLSKQVDDVQQTAQNIVATVKTNPVKPEVFNADNAGSPGNAVTP